MGVVGTLLVVLFIFLLRRFCIRRKGRIGGDMIQVTPHRQPVPTIPGSNVPLDDNSISVTSDGPYGLGIQKYGSIINEKSGRSPRIPPNIAGAEPEVGLTSTAMPGSGEENVSAWNSGYAQPLGFVPIV